MKVRINRNRLEQAFANAGITKADASRRIGRSDGYFSDMLNKGDEVYINESAVKLIESVIGISRAEFIALPDTETAAETVNAVFSPSEATEEAEQFIRRIVRDELKTLLYGLANGLKEPETTLGKSQQTSLFGDNEE